MLEAEKLSEILEFNSSVTIAIKITGGGGGGSSSCFVVVVAVVNKDNNYEYHRASPNL